jgi:DNA-binding NarL/FixJ family response regulator
MPRRRPNAPNPIDVIEAAYELERDDRDWLHHLAMTIRPLLEGGHGIVAYPYDLAQPMESWVRREILIDVPRATLKTAHAFQLSHAGGDTMEAHAVPEPLAGFRETLRKTGLHDLLADPVAMGYLEKLGARDAVAFRTIEAGGRGICIAAFWNEIGQFDRRTAALWARVAAHIAAARRLRDALRAARRSEDGIEAVLTPSGKVEHAEGESTSRSAREALREAVARAEAARGRMRRSNPHRATEAWAALVSGRWSLVDRYERGGKRYVVARRNEHGLLDPRALSPRERAVVHLVLLGKPNTLIAYELGISASGVATHLSSAMRKLGVASRVELIRLARTLAG